MEPRSSMNVGCRMLGVFLDDAAAGPGGANGLVRQAVEVSIPDRHGPPFAPTAKAVVEVLVDPSVIPAYCPHCGGLLNYDKFAPTEPDKLEAYGCRCD